MGTVVNAVGGATMVTLPQYVVFAGVNGAGKSTLFRSGLWQSYEFDGDMPRVNPDEILKRSGGSPASRSEQIDAGKQALKLAKSYLDRRISFNQETTLTGRTALSRIKQAHDLGYEVRLYYVGLASADLALERVRHRAEIGGHDIPEDDVRRRSDASIANFAKALDYCDEVRVYDNTQMLTHIAAWRKGTLCWWGGSADKGGWLLRAMQDETWRA